MNERRSQKPPLPPLPKKPVIQEPNFPPFSDLMSVVINTTAAISLGGGGTLAFLRKNSIISLILSLLFATIWLYSSHLIRKGNKIGKTNPKKAIEFANRGYLIATISAAILNIIFAVRIVIFANSSDSVFENNNNNNASISVSTIASSTPIIQKTSQQQGSGGLSPMIVVLCTGMVVFIKNATSIVLNAS